MLNGAAQRRLENRYWQTSNTVYVKYLIIFEIRNLPQHDIYRSTLRQLRLAQEQWVYLMQQNLKKGWFNADF